MRTDAELRRDVQEELRREPLLRDLEIGVAARDGAVTLTGRVDSYAQKVAAAGAAGRIVDPCAIADDTRVTLPSWLERTDTEIAGAVATALRADIRVPDEHIAARVENGWITLEGRVGWPYERLAAEHALRYLAGVRGITNAIVVEPGVATVETKDRLAVSP